MNGVQESICEYAYYKKTRLVLTLCGELHTRSPHSSAELDPECLRLDWLHAACWKSCTLVGQRTMMGLMVMVARCCVCAYRGG